MKFRASIRLPASPCSVFGLKPPAAAHRRAVVRCEPRPCRAAGALGRQPRRWLRSDAAAGRGRSPLSHSPCRL